MLTIDTTALDAAVARNAFSGAVTVDVGDERVFERSEGFAQRAAGVPNRPDTRFAMASGSKSFTALAVMAGIEAGELRLDQRVREILGDDLPLIDDAVTVEHLLTHTSGIGDYLDEDSDWEASDYVLTAPVHTLTTAEAFLPLVDGFPQKFAPGARFSYCNGGYIVLAILLERTSGRTYHDVVRERVLDPAGLARTGFTRLDELPSGTAVGYLFGEGDRANTLHLPVLGNGDGGAFTTADDLHRFWRALLAARIVPASVVADMTRPRVDVRDEGMRYGMGFWLHETGSALVLEGYDAGVSFRSTHIPASAQTPEITVSVLGNTSEGAWPVISMLSAAIDGWLAQDA